MKIDVLSLFPEMFDGVFNASILKKAAEKGIAEYAVTNFRDFTTNKHNRVDDYPYGGGAGMVLTPQPLFDAVEHLKNKTTAKPRVVMLTPQGKTFNQNHAEKLAREEHLIFLCGHYEGFDERIRDYLVTDEFSIGDYVLTGGELGAMVMVDSIVRLVPGVLGNNESAVTDSFSDGLLEHPHYTRPENFRGMTVPDVLLSGNHAKIDQWRRRQSLSRTNKRRPELIKTDELTTEESEWLKANRFESDDK